MVHSAEELQHTAQLKSERLCHHWQDFMRERMPPYSWIAAYGTLLKLPTNVARLAFSSRAVMVVSSLLRLRYGVWLPVINANRMQSLKDTIECDGGKFTGSH